MSKSRASKERDRKKQQRNMEKSKERRAGVTFSKFRDKVRFEIDKQRNGIDALRKAIERIHSAYPALTSSETFIESIKLLDTASDRIKELDEIMAIDEQAEFMKMEDALRVKLMELAMFSGQAFQGLSNLSLEAVKLPGMKTPEVGDEAAANMLLDEDAPAIAAAPSGESATAQNINEQAAAERDDVQGCRDGVCPLQMSNDTPLGRALNINIGETASVEVTSEGDVNVTSSEPITIHGDVSLEMSAPEIIADKVDLVDWMEQIQRTTGKVKLREVTDHHFIAAPFEEQPLEVQVLVFEHVLTHPDPAYGDTDAWRMRCVDQFTENLPEDDRKTLWNNLGDYREHPIIKQKLLGESNTSEEYHRSGYMRIVGGDN